MSTLEFKEKVCAVCGTRGNFPQMANVSIEVPVGIDGHPGEADALSVSVNYCTHCGYATEDIATALPGTEQIVYSPAYQKLVQESTYTESVLKFIAASLLAYKQGDIALAITMLIRGVWVAESYHVPSERISRIRRKAIDLMLICRSKGDSFEMTVWQEAYMIVEFLRREGEFDDALEICRAALSHHEVTGEVRYMLLFEEACCVAHDSSFKVLDDFQKFKASHSS
ncbi:hypothetical protein [Chitinivibrio alkaliphilus]|uniref:DUF2225 domain-containing protein n=1 Tax=Chitinivibrio alkaliphilus ACht1 TaxID=1313304 RepID=U7DAM7_9BACT|nr:hypothetical protein [Chitinivibrio alkaliphilus]ERP32182.1 hypothetical protein CALK_0912 [Chitinivibrio alkaliphilus ACht1]